MNVKLRKELGDYLIRNGAEGMTRLKVISDVKSETTIHRYINGETEPSEHVAYKLALEVGFKDAEAVLLAQDSSQTIAKDTA